MHLLYILLVLLVVTRTCGVLAARLGQPPLVGEICGGILLGLGVSQFAGSLPILSGLTDNPVLKGITDLGIFFLMLLAGVELRPRKLAETSGKAFVIALGGFLSPLGMGIGLAWAFIPDSQYKFAQCLFIGTALAITAVPVAVKVLMDLGQLKTPIGRTIVSAAVFDDVFSLILLAVLVGVVNSGEAPTITELGVLGLKIAVFFTVSTAFGLFVFPHIGAALMRSKVDEVEFTGLVVVALALSVLAEWLGLHFIIGAFLAGLFFSQQVTDQQTVQDVESKINGLTTGFLAPIFFASIGLHLDFAAVTAAPLFLAALIVVAFLGKLIGSGLCSYFLGYGAPAATALGAAMSARGAVELIVADVALRANLFSVPEPTPPEVATLFSSVVIVAVVTTLSAPIVMRFAFGAEAKEAAG